MTVLLGEHSVIGRNVVFDEREKELATDWVFKQGVRCLDVLQQIRKGELVFLGDGGPLAQEVLSGQLLDVFGRVDLLYR